MDHCDTFLGMLSHLEMSEIKTMLLALRESIAGGPSQTDMALQQPDRTTGVQSQADMAVSHTVPSERSPGEGENPTREGALRLTSNSSTSLYETEELEFDIVPTILITNRGPMFVNGARSRERTLSDWLKVTPVTDSRTDNEQETEVPPSEPDWVELLGDETGIFTVTYPFSRTECKSCAELFNEITKCAEHCKTRHKGTVSYKCNKCGKRFPKRNRVAIHYGKCKGDVVATTTDTDGERREPEAVVGQNRFEALPEVPQENLGAVAEMTDYACEVCSSRFPSKIGLGQHIRHKHPDLANTKRIEAVKHDIERKRKNRREKAEAAKPPNSSNSLKAGKGTWTQEEVDLLIALEIKHHGARFINKEISKELKSKTGKQIADKRRTLRTQQVSAPSSQSKGSGPKTRARKTITQAPESENNDIRAETRKALFKDAIIKDGPSDLVGDSAETLFRAASDDLAYKESERATIQLLRDRCKPPDKQSGRASGTERTGRAKAKRKPPKGKRAQEKAKAFKTDQFLYENDRKTLAKRLLDGKEADAKCDLDPEVVEQTYKERFGGESQEVDLSSYPQAQPVNNEALMCPFTSKQVKKAMLKANKNTSAGPDKIGLGKLRSVDRQGKALTNLFNTWLLMGNVPEEVKENRSILLPKGSEGLESINNWRPLTISSVVLRLYTGLIASRVLKEFKINERQRGFIKASGCAENGFLIEKLLEHAKRNRNTIVVAFLDLAKAFDTVSHKHIIAGLQRFQADTGFINTVLDLYSRASTTFTTSKGVTGEIPMTRGVKQGDPLSPLLFNIAMDPLFDEIAIQGNGYKFGTSDNDRIESLAYADDTALLTGSAEDMNQNLEIVHQFCLRTGMRLNVKKSAAFCIRPAGNRTYSVNAFTTPLAVGGDKVPLIKPSETTKYLGSKISPWINKEVQQLVPKLERMLEGIDRSSLRPRQKLVMLERYALPRLSFPLTQEHNPKGTLLELDRLNRSFVRKWLHLHDSTCNAVFHCRKAEGGLGLPEYIRSVPTQRINALRALLRSADPKIRRLAEAMDVRTVISKYAESASIKIPSKESTKAKWQDKPLKEWSNLPVMGKGVDTFSSRVSNGWNSWEGNVAKQSLESDYIVAMQLRTNTYPCRATLARGREINANCRRCGQTAETIGHISGHCMAVKDYRIKRHNVVTNALAEKCKHAGWKVAHEPHLKVENEVYKPDLVMVKDNKAVIVDPTIVFENGDSLRKANEAKVNKYSRLDTIIRETYAVNEVHIKGLAIGCRGGWTRENSSTLVTLGIRDPGFEQHLCKLALKGTINLMRLFSDG